MHEAVNGDKNPGALVRVETFKGHIETFSGGLPPVLTPEAFGEFRVLRPGQFETSPRGETVLFHLSQSDLYYWRWSDGSTCMVPKREFPNTPDEMYDLYLKARGFLESKHAEAEELVLAETAAEAQRQLNWAWEWEECSGNGAVYIADIMTGLSGATSSTYRDGGILPTYAVDLVARSHSGKVQDQQELRAVFCELGWQITDQLATLLQHCVGSHDLYFLPDNMRDEEYSAPIADSARCVAHVCSHAELPDLPIEPSWCYRDGQGRYVRLWLVNGLSDELHEKLMEAFVVHYGCSPEHAGSSQLVPLPDLHSHAKSFNHGSDCREGYPTVTAGDMAEAFFDHSQKQTSLRTMDMGALLAAPAVLDWTVHEYLPNDATSVIHGAPGVGKSLTAIGIALSVATGTPWQDLPVKQGPVIYLAGERAKGQSRRVQAWSAHNGVPIDNIPLLIIAGGPNLCDPNEAANLAKEVHRFAQIHGAPSLVIIDTYARHIGDADENSASTATNFNNAIDRHIRHRYGAAVLLIHHPGHSGNKKRGRGSSNLRAIVDVEYSLTQKRSQAVLKCEMANEFEFPESVHLQIISVDFPSVDGNGEAVNGPVITRCTGSVPTSKPAVSLGKNQRRALKLLREASYAQQAGDRVRLDDWLADCRDAGIDRRRLSGVQSALESHGCIEIDDRYVVLMDED